MRRIQPGHLPHTAPAATAIIAGFICGPFITAAGCRSSGHARYLAHVQGTVGPSEQQGSQFAAAFGLDESAPADPTDTWADTRADTTLASADPAPDEAIASVSDKDNR